MGSQIKGVENSFNWDNDSGGPYNTRELGNKDVESVDLYEKYQAEYDYAVRNNRPNNREEVSLGLSSSTQAKEFNELGDRAYEGDSKACEEFIWKIANIVRNAQHEKYGIKNSLIIAQIINESGWMRTPKSYNDDGTTLTNTCNNILGVNYQMNIDFDIQTSEWAKTIAKRLCKVTQKDKNNKIYYTQEAMRQYSSIEECIEDYANLIYIYHPECKNNNDIESYRSFMDGYTPVPEGEEPKIDLYKRIIEDYNLERFD